MNFTKVALENEIYYYLLIFVKIRQVKQAKEKIFIF